MFDITKFNKDKVRIVFLDIDGVLVSLKSMVATGYWPNTCKDIDLPSDNKYMGPHRTILKPPYVNHADCVDKHAVECLNKLLEATNSYVVLSSSWREGLDIDQVKLVLGAMGVNPDRVIGRTSYRGKTRGEQIWNYIQGLKEKRLGEYGDHFVNVGLLIGELEGVEMTLDSYVIIDDNYNFLPEQDKHFIQTSENEGLLLGNILRAGDILTGKPFTIAMLKYGEDTDRSLITVSA